MGKGNRKCVRYLTDDAWHCFQSELNNFLQEHDRFYVY